MRCYYSQDIIKIKIDKLISGKKNILPKISYFINNWRIALLFLALIMPAKNTEVESWCNLLHDICMFHMFMLFNHYCLQITPSTKGEIYVDIQPSGLRSYSELNEVECLGPTVELTDTCIRKNTIPIAKRILSPLTVHSIGGRKLFISQKLWALSNCKME